MSDISVKREHIELLQRRQCPSQSPGKVYEKYPVESTHISDHCSY